MFQWWIHTIGKLGPGIVAVLVLFTTRSQNRWQNMIGVRAAQVEDQKFRLALLERRNEAIEKIRAAVSEFWIDGALRQQSATAAREALRIAEFVFDDEEQAAIESFLRQIWKWQSLDRKVQRYRANLQAEHQALLEQVVDEISAFELEIEDGFEPLLLNLREATRVRSVPAVQIRSFKSRFLPHRT